MYVCYLCVCVSSDQSPAEADLNYLSNATKMELYGVELQDAMVSRQRTSLLIICTEVSFFSRYKSFPFLILPSLCSFPLFFMPVPASTRSLKPI